MKVSATDARIAKFTFWAVIPISSAALLENVADVIPSTKPSRSTTGPPELPGWIPVAEHAELRLKGRFLRLYEHPDFFDSSCWSNGGNTEAQS